MAKRETIGKIQLVLGIILLVGAIIWAAYSYNQIDEKNEWINFLVGDNMVSSKEYPNVSNETILMINLWRSDLIAENKFVYDDRRELLQYVVVFTVILSLITILQGLSNMGDKR